MVVEVASEEEGGEMEADEEEKEAKEAREAKEKCGLLCVSVLVCVCCTWVCAARAADTASHIQGITWRRILLERQNNVNENLTYSSGVHR